MQHQSILIVPLQHGRNAWVFLGSLLKGISLLNSYGASKVQHYEKVRGIIPVE